MSEPSTEPAPSADPAAADPPVPTEPATPEPKDWESEAAKWKRQARENEARAKANADAAKRLAEIEDAAKSEAEKLAEKLAAAEERVAAATKRAVSAQIKAMATGRFADSSDAVDALTASGVSFLDDGGQIDETAIEAALADLLERKKHWAAPDASGPRTPAPDPAQGARPGAIPTLAAQIAEAERSGDIKASIALKSRQLREIQSARK
jgi:hypothetical protein